LKGNEEAESRHETDEPTLPEKAESSYGNTALEVPTDLMRVAMILPTTAEDVTPGANQATGGALAAS